MGQIKVEYTIRDGTTKSKAYVDEDSLLGTDKYTNVDVQLQWNPLSKVYTQIDSWEWDFDMFGEPHKRAIS